MHKSFAVFAAGLITISASVAMAATPYVNLSSGDNQVAMAPMQPVPVTLSGGPAAGFTVSGSKLTFTEAGDYFVYAAAQIGGSMAGSVYLWPRVNGKDVDDSNSVQNIPSPQFTAVLVSAGEMSFKAGDVLEFMYAASAPGLGLIATKPSGMPAVPAILLTTYKLP
jgi:hypothetical protein